MALVGCKALMGGGIDEVRQILVAVVAGDMGHIIWQRGEGFSGSGGRR